MPSIDYGNAPAWLQFLIALVAIIGFILAIIGFIRKVWPIITRFVRTVNSLAELPTFIEESKEFRNETKATLAAQDEALGKQDTKIAEIHHETHRNDGSSIKDAVTRSENAIERVELGVKGLYDRLNLTDAEAAQLRRDFDDTKPVPPRKRTTKPPRSTT